MKGSKVGSQTKLSKPTFQALMHFNLHSIVFSLAALKNKITLGGRSSTSLVPPKFYPILPLPGQEGGNGAKFVMFLQTLPHHPTVCCASLVSVHFLTICGLLPLGIAIPQCPQYLGGFYIQISCAGLTAQSVHCPAPPGTGISALEIQTPAPDFLRVHKEFVHRG